MTPKEFREARHSLGLSQAKIAGELGVNVRTIKRWEAGDTNIPKTVELAIRTLINV